MPKARALLSALRLLLLTTAQAEPNDIYRLPSGLMSSTGVLATTTCSSGALMVN